MGQKETQNTEATGDKRRKYAWDGGTFYFKAWGRQRGKGTRSPERGRKRVARQRKSWKKRAAKTTLFKSRGGSCGEGCRLGEENRDNESIKVLKEGQTGALYNWSRGVERKQEKPRREKDKKCMEKPITETRGKGNQKSYSAGR